MNTQTETYTNNTLEQLRLLAIIRTGLQSLVTLHNLRGDQEGAHRASRELCAVLALEFRLNPNSSRSKNMQITKTA